MNRKLKNLFYLRNKRIKKTNEENNDLKTLNSSLKKKNNELKWKFNNLWKNSKVLSNENKNLSKQVLDLIKDNNENINKIKSLKEKNKKSTIEIKLLEKKIKNLNKKKKYELSEFINFQEFLSKSYISPITEAPFVHEDKRVFAFMDHLGKKLRKNISEYDEPLISIILPANNKKNNIKNTIKSILNQTYNNFELIIINNNNDNIIRTLKSIPDKRIKNFTIDKNKSCSYMYNIGLKNAKGDIIMYLNQYNEWDSEYIKTMIGAFIELPDADAIYSGQYLYKDFNSNPFAIQFAPYNKTLLHNHNFIDLNCFCHKKDILNKIEGFDEKLFLLEDWDFILKISNIFKIYSIPVILSKQYRTFDEDNSKSNLNYLRTSKKILDKNKIPNKKYPPLTKKISIIIPNYESLTQIKMCLNSIFSNESEMIDIIVVDNNSREEVKNFLIEQEKKGKIRLILNKINYGFTYAVNQGISISEKDSDMLILNNDAILTKGSIEHMQNCAYSTPKCGLVVPHEMLFEQNKSISKNVPYADNNFECDITPSKIHHNIINIPLFYDGGLLELNFAPFFCTYIKRDVYENTLGLDPELGRHYRSDRIFSDFVRHYLGLKIYQAPYAFVYHRHQVATEKLKENNKEEYKYIYGKNQWPPVLSNKLGFKKPIWDD